ncbi:MAG TPA: AIR synthase-related protein [Nitrososphaerales archaeon]|nr:AIR synthase-related protein [Nitrososphaerales archaeon]
MDSVYRHLGRLDKKVIVGPGRGLDNAFIDLQNGKVMVISTDPVSMIPQVGPSKSAWLSVHLIASDVATSGVPPEFAAFSLNLPEEMGVARKKEYVSSLGDACKELSVTVVSGHTGTYPGAGFTVVGGGVMFAFVNEDDYVDPTMANVGDRVLMTKGSAIEATASLAWAFPTMTEKKVGKKLFARAKSLLHQCTVVKDAMIAKSIGLGKGGVSSMHDATEGGVLGALDEMASASTKAFVVDPDSILVSEETKAVCSAFGIDPLTSLSEGTLLLTCGPGRVSTLRERVSGSGLRIAEVGIVESGTGLWLSREGGRRTRFRPKSDGYWEAYNSSVKARTK